MNYWITTALAWTFTKPPFISRHVYVKKAVKSIPARGDRVFIYESLGEELA